MRGGHDGDHTMSLDFLLQDYLVAWAYSNEPRTLNDYHLFENILKKTRRSMKCCWAKKVLHKCFATDRIKGKNLENRKSTKVYFQKKV